MSLLGGRSNILAAAMQRMKTLVCQCVGISREVADSSALSLGFLYGESKT